MLSEYPTISEALERAERKAEELPHVACVTTTDWDTVVLANEVRRLRRELAIVQSHNDKATAEALFTDEELLVLGKFYSGTRAHALRSEFNLDPWAIVHRHRHLPTPEYEAVTAAAEESVARSKSSVQLLNEFIW